MTNKSNDYEHSKKTNYFFSKSWLSVFGPIFICEVLNATNTEKRAANKILPTNKLEQMCMERLFGIALQQEGFDSSNAIQGENFSTTFDTQNFEKIFYNCK